jgi:hypothetical protein
MRRFREQARRCVLRELDRQLQQRGSAAIAVKSKAALTEIPETAAAVRRQDFAN